MTRERKAVEVEDEKEPGKEDSELDRGSNGNAQKHENVVSSMDSIPRRCVLELKKVEVESTSPSGNCTENEITKPLTETVPIDFTSNLP
ncbi:hypothetical protein EGR_10250 [Echinococcus granulosus]|uniref:Uncharacterized protein n=1 Tax=Echinococcus granulosus TaxID=6210 RepID=W6UMZ2_ECHGR|nr:hypothetical protein EGR_10250 [Echinococcus granulosus]EUB54889.1 hypothetical protein EGR_10250 [Echinococcus granulosus]